MRPIAKIFLGILLILMALLAMFLLPQHLQIRQVNPPLPSEQSLRGLLEVPSRPTDVRYLTTSTQEGGIGLLSHNSVLIEWPNGDMVMIDAGMDAEAAVEFGELLKSMGPAEDVTVLGEIGQMLGSDISRVKAVGFTHLHIDHTQGLVNFCQARGEGALALQTGYQHKLQNFNTEEGAVIISRSCLKADIRDGDGLIEFDRFPGLAMYPLGGHTPGSTLFVVAHGDRLLLFSGDITNNKADILNDQGKGFLYSYLFVPENTARTGQLRDWLRSLNQQDDIEVVVSHDLNDMQTVLQAY
ncbi:MAG: MBL fold metallo-hydrolase [Halioglobus sp.]